MWSLVAEDGTSTNNRTEKLPNAIDPQYTVGFSWMRQPAIRIQQRWGDVKTGAFTAALSVEQAQITGFTATSATSGAVPTNFYLRRSRTGRRTLQRVQRDLRQQRCPGPDREGRVGHAEGAH